MTNSRWVDFNKAFPYKSVTLEQLGFYLNLRVPLEITKVPEFSDVLEYQIRGYVWSQDAGKRVNFKYPADWWQAFKERWFPKWLLSRFPVVYTHREFVVKATYPDLKVQNHDPILRLIESQWTDSIKHVNDV